jgi:hypothetical protein
MITQQQFLDAVADFEALILEGRETGDAIGDAATSIGMRPAAFQQRLAREMSIEARVEKIRRDAEYNRFLAAAGAEIEIWRRDPWAHGTNAFDSEGKVLKIKEGLGKALGRELTEHEVWKIGELLDPFGTQLRMEPKDRRILNELLHRQIEC